MKTLLISVLLISLMFVGCKKETNPVTPATDERVSFEINFLEYSDNNYFIGEIYTDTSKGLNTFNLFYGEPVPSVLEKYLVKNIEVYISTASVDSNINSFLARAYINLPSRSSTNMYSDSLRNNNEISAGLNATARFKLLNEGSEYYIQRYTGYIKLLFPLKDQDIIAAAYRIENDNPSESDDLLYGEFISELVNNSKTRGVLKLIKPAGLVPSFEKAWKLKMKNFYQIKPFIGTVTDLDLDIFLRNKDGSETNTINNIKLLEVFGFDKITEDGYPGPDGKFDNRTNFTFVPLTSEILFPVLQPFGKNIPNFLKNYKYQAIYDSIKSYMSLPEKSFIIRGKYKPE